MQKHVLPSMLLLGSTVVDHLANYLEIEGSNPTWERENEEKNSKFEQKILIVTFISPSIPKNGANCYKI
jgi:hypothetical protein